MCDHAANAVQTVLIIGGNPTLLTPPADYLRRSGVDVIRSPDGEAGLEQAQRARPDLILLAIDLPGIDGLETCRRLKAAADTQEIPVIFVISKEEISTKAAAFAAGGADCIASPFSAEEVSARVRPHLELVRKRRMEKDVQAWINRYELTVAASGQVAYEYFVPTGDIAWGSSIHAVLGYSMEELGGGFSQWNSLLHPDDRTWVEAILDAAMRDCGYWDAQYRLRHKNGHYVWIRDRGFFLPDAQGRASRRLGLLEDITGKKKAEEELRYRNTLLSTQQEVSPDGILVVDPGGRILSWNRRFVDLWGIPDEVMESRSDELAIQSVTDKLSDPEGFRREIADLYAHPQRTGRHELALTDGRVFERYSSPVRAGDGTDYGRVWYFSDVTDRKRAEEGLKSSQRWFAAIFRANPAAVAIVRRRDNQVVDINDAFTRLFGYTREECVGRAASELGFWTDPTDLLDLKHLLESEGSVHDRESKFQAKDGRVLTVLYTVEGADLENEPCLLSIFSDITERKRAEETLRKSEQRFATIFLANPAPISILRYSDRRFIDVNEAHARLFGFPREAYIGRTSQELGLWADPQERDCLIEPMHVQGSVRDAEIRLRAADGRTLTALVTIESVELGDERCVVCLFNDITQRKLHEEERARLEAQLQQAQKLESIGRLAGGVAHDFNNLLSVINGYSELLLPSMAPEDEKHFWIEQIRVAGEKATTLARQLLAFSRRQIIQPRPLNLNEVIGGTEKILRRLIGEDIDMQTRLAPGLGAVFADPGQIDQLLMNLAINARDAMPDGGRLLIETADIDIDAGYQAGHAEATVGPFVLLAVSDTGVGMDAETQQHIFEPFFTTKERGHGTGLGLATVYGIVKQSGGWISVYSEPGKGTVFKIYLPMTREPGRALERREAVTSDLRGSETVLLVEDQEEVRNLAVSALREYGYRALPTADGAEALDLLQRYDASIAVMVTDIVLPGMNGGELAQRVASLRPQIKIIYTSGYTCDFMANHGVQAEDVEFLPKPYTAVTLAAHIRKVLDRQSLPKK